MGVRIVNGCIPVDGCVSLSCSSEEVVDVENYCLGWIDAFEIRHLPSILNVDGYTVAPGGINGIPISGSATMVHEIYTTSGGSWDLWRIPGGFSFDTPCPSGGKVYLFISCPRDGTQTAPGFGYACRDLLPDEAPITGNGGSLDVTSDDPFFANTNPTASGGFVGNCCADWLGGNGSNGHAYFEIYE